MSTTEPSAETASQGIKRRREGDDLPDYKRQRPNYVQPAFPRLRKLFTCLGEPSRFPLPESILHCAKSFTSAELDEEAIMNLFSLFVNISIEQPLKVFSLAAALQCVNHAESTHGAAVVKHIVERTQRYVDSGDWNNVKLVLRFLIMLKPIISNFEVVVDFIGRLLERAIALKKLSTGRNPLAEELYRVVLLTLPYLVVIDSSEEMKKKATEIVEKSKEFKQSSAVKAEELLNPFVDGEAPYRLSDSLELVQIQLGNLVEAEWDLQLLYDYSTIVPASDFEKHSIDKLQLPETLSASNRSTSPDVFLTFYTNQQVETTPAVDRIESTIFRDLLTDTIMNLSFNRQEVARQLIWFDNFLRPGLFAPRETSLERLSQAKPGTSTWKPEDVAVEAVLAGLFRLPKSLLKPVYFHSVLIEACILAPHAIAPVFGRAIRFLYSHLEHLDVQVIHLYADWFSHHLSNFGFTWKWREWTDDLNLNELHPKRVFIRELIHKELRLSFPQRISETLPDELSDLVPDRDDVPPFTFALPDNPYSEQSRLVLQNIRDRKGVDEFEDVFEEIEKKSDELNDENDARDKVREIFVTAILHLGARSLSHVESWIERGLPVLGVLYPEKNAESQRQVTKIIFKYWKDQTGTAVQVVKKLMNHKVITPLSVVEWILIDSDVSSLTKGHSWELLGFAIEKAKQLIKNAEAVPRTVEGEDGEEAGAKFLDEDKLKEVDDNIESLKSTLNHIFITIVKELSRPVQGDAKNEESVRWQRWWKEGFLRAVLRNYHADYKDLQEPLKNLGLTDMFIMNCIEQTAEL
ncbi:MIF4G like-domain-containing protein [Lipomyces kononenkoae]|uniref:MIF4G like-domain-containing protein n=1 Tax=Lipomyces kononenkoae TaxID=34357 RepID=A0ACC3T5W3_LIPKO